MSVFSLASLVAWALVALVAGVVRGRLYAFFVSVLLGVYTLVATGLAAHTGTLFYAYAYFHATVYASFVLLARPRMRPVAFRALVSWPASWFLGSTLLAFPWAIAAASGLRPAGLWIPYAVGLAGFADTFFPRRGTVHVVVGEAAHGDLARMAHATGRDPRPLRIVQITDPHLGPFMSVGRLRRICERAVASDPDRPPDRRLPDHGVTGRPFAPWPGARAARRAPGSMLRLLREP